MFPPGLRNIERRGPNIGVQEMGPKRATEHINKRRPGPFSDPRCRDTFPQKIRPRNFKTKLVDVTNESAGRGNNNDMKPRAHARVWS